MIINNIELYYMESFNYLPSIKHTVLSLSVAEADEEGDIIRFSKGLMSHTNGNIEDYINKNKFLRLKFEGSRGSHNVKVNKAWIDKFEKKVNLEVVIVNDFLSGRKGDIVSKTV